MKVENNQQSQPNMSQKMDEMLQQPAQPVAPQPMQPMGGAAKVKKKKNIPAIVLGVVAVLGIGAAAYFGVQYFGEKDRADNLAKAETSVPPTPPTESAEAPSGETSATVDSSEYIYIGEWGYKIKIPEGLNKVSYAYKVYNGDYKDGWSTSINVWGVKGDKLYDFANTYALYDTAGENLINTLQFPLGIVTREKKGLNADCQTSCGTVIFEDDEWEYTYEHPQAVSSTNETEEKIEQASVDAIRQMLSNKENYSKI